MPRSVKKLDVSGVEKVLVAKNAAHMPVEAGLDLMMSAEQPSMDVHNLRSSDISPSEITKLESPTKIGAVPTRMVVGVACLLTCLLPLLVRTRDHSASFQQFNSKFGQQSADLYSINAISIQDSAVASQVSGSSAEAGASMSWREAASNVEAPASAVLVGEAWGSIAAINDTWTLHMERQFVIETENSSASNTPLIVDVQDMEGSGVSLSISAPQPQPEQDKEYAMANTTAQAKEEVQAETEATLAIVPESSMQPMEILITSIEFVAPEGPTDSKAGAMVVEGPIDSKAGSLVAEVQGAAPTQAAATTEPVPAHAARPKDSSKSSKRRKQKEKETKAKEERNRKSVASAAPQPKAKQLQSNVPTVAPSLFTVMWSAESMTASLTGLRAIGIHPNSEAAWTAAMHAAAPLDPALMASMYIQVAFSTEVRVHPITSRLCVTVLADPPQRSDGLDAAHACLTPPLTKQYVAAQQQAEAYLPVFRLTGLAANTAYRVQMLLVDMRGNGHKASSSIGRLQAGEPGVLEGEAAGQPQLLPVFQGAD